MPTAEDESQEEWLKATMAMRNRWIELCITYLSNVELSIKIVQNAIEAERDEAWLSTLQSAAESHRRHAEKLEREKKPATFAC